MGSAWHMVKSVMLAVIIIISSPVHSALGGGGVCWEETLSSPSHRLPPQLPAWYLQAQPLPTSPTGFHL